MRFYICLKKGQDYQVILALASAIPEQVRLPVAFHNVAERNLNSMRDPNESPPPYITMFYLPHGSMT